MYQKEKMSRLSKWFFGIPLIYTLWMFLSLAMPRFATSNRIELLFNIVSYALFIAVALVVIKRFLVFPISKMLGEDNKLDWKGLAVGFAVMLIMQLAINFIDMKIHPNNYTFTLEKSGFLIDWLLAFMLVVLAAFLEELLLRAYIAHFLANDMETRPPFMLYYSLVSAVLFAIAHFANPEVSGTGAYYAMTFYFMMGFTLMLITLKTRSIGAALGIHIANNLINAWFFTYDNAAIKTNALYTQTNNEGPLLLVQAAICLVVCTFVILAFDRNKQKSQEISK